MLTNGDEILRRVNRGEKLVIEPAGKSGIKGYLVTDKAKVMYYIENISPGYYRELSPELQNDPDIIESVIKGFERIKGLESSPERIERIDEQIGRYNTLLEEVKGKQR